MEEREQTMAEDKLYMKDRYDSIFEKNMTVVFAVGMLAYVVVFFCTVFLLPRPLAVPWLVISMLIFVYMVLFLNWRKNMSASTALIRRDGVFYAVQILYTNEALGTETDRSLIHAPAGTVIQGAALVNDYMVGRDVQAHEREVRQRRKDPQAFINGLDDILSYLKENPEKYIVKPYERKSLSEKLDHTLENADLCFISTKASKYKFLILNHPEIAKENEKYFVINFYNEQNELCSVKFTNCYGDIIEDLR